MILSTFSVDVVGVGAFSLGRQSGRLDIEVVKGEDGCTRDGTERSINQSVSHSFMQINECPGDGRVNWVGDAHAQTHALAS